MKSLRVLVMPVEWALMDDCIFCMSSASVIDGLLLFDSLNIICVVGRLFSCERHMVVG